MNVRLVKTKQWDSQWSILRTASALLELPYVTLGKPDEKADINYFPNYDAVQKVGKSIVVGRFTERRQGLEKRFDEAYKTVDYAVFESKDWAREKDYVIPEWVDKQFFHRITIGIASKESGSKGHKWLKDFIKECATASLFNWKWADGKVAYKDMPAWYRSLDYLIVPSESEGFCMPIAEAIMSGVPVICRDSKIPLKSKANFLFKDELELELILQDIDTPQYFINKLCNKTDYITQFDLMFKEIYKCIKS